jgi:N-acetylglutamate synthase-like GNAT family acetyltransferase
LLKAEAFILRSAAQADFPAIRALIHTAGINPTGLDWRRFIVAVTPQGELVGCGQVKPHRDGSLELASIAVVPHMRGKGVARLIIERLLVENTGELYLTCRASLGPFYNKFGFRIAELRGMPRYFRTVVHFAGVIRRLGIMDESLLVMKRDKPEGSPA